MSIVRQVFSEICPCDHCHLNPECKEKFLACDAFGQYVLTGRFKMQSMKNPTKEKYISIFKGQPKKEEFADNQRRLK